MSTVGCLFSGTEFMQSQDQKKLQIILTKNPVGKESQIYLIIDSTITVVLEKIFHFLKIKNVLKYFCKEVGISM